MSLAYKLYRLKYRYGKHLPLSKPVDISLELSSVCNMACSYCYHSDQDNLPFVKGYMDKDIAFKIIKDAAKEGVHSVKFNWKGESTLNPHFREITEYAKRLSGGMTFIDRLSNSNFKIPKVKREDKFHGMAALTKVKVSYDSFIPDVFETQRAKGNHDLTTENIDLFYNHPARIKSETQLVIQAVRTKLNKDEDIVHKVKSRWPEAKVSLRDVVEGRVANNIGELADKERDASSRRSCIQAHTRLIFAHDGRCLPCCPDIKEELEIGNGKRDSIREIFNGKKAKVLRRALLNKSAFLDDPCKSCSSYESYSGYKAPWDS